jgi:hypothetical protein
MKGLSYEIVSLRTTSVLTSETVLYEFLKASHFMSRRNRMTDEEKLQMLNPPRTPSTFEDNLKKRFRFHRILDKENDATNLFQCLNIMAKGESFHQALKNKFVKFIIRRLDSSKDFDRIVGDRYDDLRPDQGGFRFPIFHCSTYPEWKRTKAKVLEVIRLFELDALLSTDRKTYEERFQEGIIYRGVDYVFCYFILSLVHFKLFSNLSEELDFFERLLASDTKTRDCLELINKRVSTSLASLSSFHGKREARNNLFLRLGDEGAVYLNEIMFQDDLFNQEVKLYDYFNGDINTDLNSNFIEYRIKSIANKIRASSSERATEKRENSSNERNGLSV